MIRQINDCFHTDLYMLIVGYHVVFLIRTSPFIESLFSKKINQNMLKAETTSLVFIMSCNELFCDCFWFFVSPNTICVL